MCQQGDDGWLNEDEGNKTLANAERVPCRSPIANHCIQEEMCIRRAANLDTARSSASTFALDPMAIAKHISAGACLLERSNDVLFPPIVTMSLVQDARKHND